jgi:perosamine synthetase
MFIDALSNCDYITPQHTPSDCSHSYFTLGLLFDGKERGISWQEFREKYISFGGDGFYGAWSVPYLEPVMQNRTFVKRYPEIYEDVVYEKGLCPVAESIQPKIMQFKTNYRDIDLASRKAKALKNTIDFFNKTEELPSV